MTSRHFLRWAFAAVLLSLVFALPQDRAYAQTASMTASLPGGTTYTPNTSFTVAITVDPGGETVNAAQVFLDFDPAVVEVVAPAFTNTGPTSGWLAIPSTSSNFVGYAVAGGAQSVNTPFAFVTINLRVRATATGGISALTIRAPGSASSSVLRATDAAQILSTVNSVNITVNAPTATPTNTNTPLPPTNTPTNTPVPPPTNTPLPPTNTFTPAPPTNTPTVTNTPDPSIPTATPTNTFTPAPPTNTPVPGATNTPVPPPTNTPAPSVPTNTPVPGSPTNTPVPGGSGGTGSAPGLPPLCADFIGSTNQLVRAFIPPNTATSPGRSVNIYCRVLSIPAEISVPNERVLGAVEVFALTTDGQLSITVFNNSMRICLLGTGGILFRDANGAPRITREISSFVSGGYTCADIPNAGSVILVARAGIVQPTNTPAPNVNPPVPSGLTHVVQRGENLFRISLRYGVSLNALAAINGISNPSRIFVGQVLVIPAGGFVPAPTAMPTRVPPTATPTRAVPTATRPSGSTTATPLPTPTAIVQRTHVVQAGENLFRIALRYGIPLNTLAAANGIANPRLIYAGQVLVIPNP